VNITVPKSCQTRGLMQPTLQVSQFK